MKNPEADSEELVNLACKLVYSNVLLSFRYQLLEELKSTKAVMNDYLPKIRDFSSVVQGMRAYIEKY